MSKLDEVKKKIDNKMAEKPEVEKEPEEEEKDKPTVWTPFAKKIYTDIKLYKAKLGDAQPTRAVATKFRNDIEEKLEKGKEKDSVIKFYNSQFKLPGVSTLPWNYFAENIIDTNAKEKSNKELIKKVRNLVNYNKHLDNDQFAVALIDLIKNHDKPKESFVNEESSVNEGTTEYLKLLDVMEKKYGHIPAWRTMIDAERKRLKQKKVVSLSKGY